MQQLDPTAKLSTRLGLLLIGVLAVSMFLVPQTTANLGDGLTLGEAEFVGEVDVSTLPDAPDTIEAYPLLKLGSLNPDPQTMQAAKEQLSQPGIQTPGTKTVVSPKGGSFIKIQKNFAGTSGAIPNACVCSPPDVVVGASNKHVVQMVNLAATIFTTSGTVAKPTFSLSDFWGLPTRGGPLGIGMSDPVVEFDPIANRWFASILNTFQVNRVRFAVSQTDNPLGIWYIYSVSTPAANILPDQPYIGYSDDKFIITANDFLIDTNTGAAAFVGVQYWIFNKAQMLTGSSVGTTRLPNFASAGPDNTKFTIRPAQHLSTTGPSGIAYMIENCLTVAGVFLINVCPDTGAGGAALYAIKGVPGVTPVTVTRFVVEIEQTGFPPDAQQPGTNVLLATNDNRILGTVWRDNKLWFTLTDSCTPEGDNDDRSCVRLVQLQTNGDMTPPTVLQDFDLGIAGAYLFYPGVSTDTNQNLVVVFGISSTTIYPSLQVTGQLSTMPAETLGPVLTIKAGAAPDLSTRYGDYFWAATQPNNPSTFWVSGEHRQISLFQGWTTQIASVQYTQGA